MRIIVIIAFAIIIYLWQQSLYRRIWDRHLTVSLSFDLPYMHVGEEGSLTEVIDNAKFLPLPVFHVKFSTTRDFRFKDQINTVVTDSYHRNDAYSLLGNQKITRKLTFTAEKRGYFHISGAGMIARDFFMTRTFAKLLPCDSWIYVLPERVRLPELDTSLSNILGELEARRSLVEDPYTFRGIREYGPEDDMRRINWKASARRQSWMVNVYGFSALQRVKILVNFEPNMMLRTEYMEELSISVASTVAAGFLEKSIPVKVMSNGKDILTKETGEVDFGAAAEHALTVDKYLARISSHTGIEGFFHILDREIKEQDRESAYIVVSPYFKQDLLIKLDYMRSRGMDVHMIVPYFDIQERTDWRPYMQGLEVAYVET